MPKATSPFQVFLKPAGPACNLACDYCYYLPKADPLAPGDPRAMPPEVLETYIAQHVAASPGPEIAFSWHGGEPTILGVDFFRRAVGIQEKHRPRGCRILNGIQTNGTLLDEKWCRFLAEHRFAVGLSLDGPPDLHDAHRRTRSGGPTHERVMAGHRLLFDHGLDPDILCVVHADNVGHPDRLYGFFKGIGARRISFLPMVSGGPGAAAGRDITVPAQAWGAFLCAVFDEWMARDIGRIRIQVFEEMAETALGRDHAMCIFNRVCGRVPVVERTGDFYACDHFVDAGHRWGDIRETPLLDMLDGPSQKRFGERKSDGLPRYCRECEYLALCHGGCPKDRLARTPAGEPGLNLLCEGYRRFFRHTAEFREQLAALHGPPDRVEPASASRTTPPRAKVGRNEPCPCGSGQKYKKCCMGK